MPLGFESCKYTGEFSMRQVEGCTFLGVEEVN